MANVSKSPIATINMIKMMLHEKQQSSFRMFDHIISTYGLRYTVNFDPTQLFFNRPHRPNIPYDDR